MRIKTIIGFLIFSASLAVSGCGDKGTQPEESKVSYALSKVIDINIGQPSGITMDEKGENIWVVGGSSERIYKITKEGVILETLAYKGSDPEGIAYDPADSTLWVAEERQRLLVHLDLKGNFIGSIPVGLTGDNNNGIEGVCLDNNGGFFMVNEKKPGLFLELGRNFTLKALSEIEFASDYSDIAYCSGKNYFFVLSDESKGFFIYSRDKKVLQRFDLPCTKFEGIASTPNGDKLYLVNDSLNTLSLYTRQ